MGSAPWLLLHRTVLKSFGGWRQTVEIIQAGLEGCRELPQTIRALNV